MIVRTSRAKVGHRKAPLSSPKPRKPRRLRGFVAFDRREMVFDRIGPLTIVLLSSDSAWKATARGRPRRCVSPRVVQGDFLRCIRLLSSPSLKILRWASAHFLFLATVDLEALIQSTLQPQGYELVDLQTTGKQQRLVRVFIDRPEGITVEDCAEVSRHLLRLFEVEQVWYDRLEVSSPGLDRPLKRPADFERFVGSRAAVTLRVPQGGRKRFIGELKAIEAGTLSMMVDGALVLLPLEDVDKARLVPEI